MKIIGRYINEGIIQYVIRKAAGEAKMRAIKWEGVWKDYPAMTTIEDPEVIEALDDIPEDEKLKSGETLDMDGELDIKNLKVANFQEEFGETEVEYKFVVATPMDHVAFEQNAHIRPSLDELQERDERVVYDVAFQNTKGLPEVYNKYLDPINDGRRIVYVHDDVILDDNKIIDKLDEAHKRFDIVGIAGARTTKLVRNPKAMWHQMPNNGLHGFCSHAIPNTDQFNSSYFGPTPSEVTMVDGVFMSVDVGKCLERGVKFDEDFSFHFYDLSFCLRAKAAGLKVGVYPIFLRHWGQGFPDGDFEELEETFIQKYGSYL